ncbi:hypothetical protein OAN61_00140 [bacterium]|nr:hypothetical protein [bacterium]
MVTDKDGNGILTRSEIHKIGEVLPESMNYSAFEYWHEERMYMGGAVPARGFNDEEMQYQFKDIDMNDDKILTKDELVLYATPSKAERDQYRDYARRAIKGQTFGHFDPLGLLGDAHDPDAVHDPTQGVGMFQFMHHIAPHLALKDGRADMIFHVLDKDQDMHLSPTELQQIKEYFHEL